MVHYCQFVPYVFNSSLEPNLTVHTLVTYIRDLPRFFDQVGHRTTKQEHSVEEVLERPTGYPKVGGSNHGSGDFSLQPQRNPYLS